MASNTKVRDDDARGSPAGAFGQPAHEPTEETRHQVETMVGLGMTRVEIGKVLRISDDTVTRHYQAEIERGKAVKGMEYRQRLHDMVTGKNAPEGASADAILRASVPALFFALKTQFGFRERERGDAAPDGPAAHEHPAETVRNRLRALAERAGEAGDGEG
jgi:hypothetical protein